MMPSHPNSTCLTHAASLRLLLTIWLAIAGSAMADGSYWTMRDGLPNLRHSVAGDETFRTQTFGGTFMAGERIQTRSAFRAGAIQHLLAAFPEASTSRRNAVYPGTGSWMGAFRAQPEVVGPGSHPPLRLVLIEFASEDTDETPERATAALEGIVRQIRAGRPMADILIVSALGPGDLERFERGEIPPGIQAMETVAGHYGLPSVNLARAAADHITGGNGNAGDFVRPEGYANTRAQAWYLTVFEEFATAFAAHPLPDQLLRHDLPDRLSPAAMDQAKMVPYEHAAYDANWLDWQQSPEDRFLHVVQSAVPGALITVQFRGDTVGLFDVIGPDAADLEYSVNDGAWARIPSGGAETWSARHVRLAEGLNPAQDHLLTVRLPQDLPHGHRARIAFFLVNGEAVFDNPLQGLSALDRLDAIYASMPPLDYSPPADRFTFLPRTLERLRNGPILTIVMLGDSIINDTGGSEFHHLLMRHYPNCTINRVRSVRGSTGCWWYKDDNRVQPFVLDHDPDLLMIGGISQRNDTESIREVIRQVRRARPEIEILLMSGAFGRMDPHTDPEWTAKVPREGDAYRTRLKQLAEETGCAFMDFTGPWGEYIRSTDQALGSFKRDPIHANNRGRQLLGRMLERFFMDDDHASIRPE